MPTLTLLIKCDFRFLIEQLNLAEPNRAQPAEQPVQSIYIYFGNTIFMFTKLMDGKSQAGNVALCTRPSPSSA